MTDFPDLKIKAQVSFPARVLDGTGVDVVKANGSYQFNLAYDDFAPPIAVVPDVANQSVLLWNSITQAYALAPVTLLASSGVIPVGFDGSPAMDNVALPGVLTTYARGDHVHPSDTSKVSVSGFAEAVDDRVASLLTAGTNVTLNYDDTANTLTISSSGGAGGQPLDATLTALAGMTTTADRVPYFTGIDVAAVTPLTSFGRSLIDDADATAARATIVLGNVDNTSDASKPVSTAQAAADALRVLKAGDTMSGNLTISKSNPQIHLDCTGTLAPSEIFGERSGAPRWQLRLGDGTTESGANAGSNFNINRYSDGGSYLGTPFSINRATGVCTVQLSLTVELLPRQFWTQLAIQGLIDESEAVDAMRGNLPNDIRQFINTLPIGQRFEARMFFLSSSIHRHERVGTDLAACFSLTDAAVDLFFENAKAL